LPQPNSIASIRKTLNLAGHELKVLHQICQSISCTLNLDQILKQIIDLVVDVTHGDSCLLYLLDEAGESLVLRASKNPHPRIIGKISLRVGEGITGWVAQENTLVAIPRAASKDARFKFFHKLPEDRYAAFISVPIIAPTDRVTGVINVQHRKEHRHSVQEKTLLSIIGHQVGGAIENARLYEEAQRRAQHLSAVARVGEIVVSGKYLEEMLQLIVGFVAGMLQARVCSIMLVDNNNELALKAAKCSTAEYRRHPGLKVGKSLIGRVVKEKKPLITPDVMREADYCYPELAEAEGVRSLLSVPMTVKDRVIGVLSVYDIAERVFTGEDVRVLLTVAAQAALAIENTKLALEAQESQEALQTRKLVDRAKRILMRQSQLSEEDAYRRLQQQSMRTRRSMREIAEAVLLADEIQS
jgi:signal transduction protein with GAF and PtsI domain